MSNEHEGMDSDVPEDKPTPTIPPYGQYLPRKDIQFIGYAPIPVKPVTKPIEWFQEVAQFWIGGILPIIIAWFAWKSLKLRFQQRQDNRKGYCDLEDNTKGDDE